MVVEGHHTVLAGAGDKITVSGGSTNTANTESISTCGLDKATTDPYSEIINLNKKVTLQSST